MLTSCSCGESGHSSHKPDAEAVKAGEAAAQSMIEISADEEAVTDRLLEIRSEIYDVSKQRGEEAALDFEQAFETYLRDNCDSLANIIL